MILTALIVPWLSDLYGRKWPFIISYGMFLIAHIAIGMSDDIYVLYWSRVMLFCTLNMRHSQIDRE